MIMRRYHTLRSSGFTSAFCFLDIYFIFRHSCIIVRIVVAVLSTIISIYFFQSAKTTTWGASEVLAKFYLLFLLCDDPDPSSDCPEKGINWFIYFDRALMI